MANWGNTDDAANSVLWATTQVKLTPNTDNQANLFSNSTADAFITGLTVGQFGVDAAEARAARAGANTKVAHAGWVLRTVGSGGRANRVQNETLVAMKNLTSDSEDAVFPDFKLSILTQPLANTANTSAGENATLRVVASSVPAGASFTYAWKYANGDSIQAGANVGVTTAANLVINSAVQTATASFKVTVGATGTSETVTSTNATLTITT
jgi:hypothetical protein